MRGFKAHVFGRVLGTHRSILRRHRTRVGPGRSLASLARMSRRQSTRDVRGRGSSSACEGRQAQAARAVRRATRSPRDESGRTDGRASDCHLLRRNDTRIGTVLSAAHVRSRWPCLRKPAAGRFVRLESNPATRDRRRLFRCRSRPRGSSVPWIPTEARKPNHETNDGAEKREEARYRNPAQHEFVEACVGAAAREKPKNEKRRDRADSKNEEDRSGHFAAHGRRLTPHLRRASHRSVMSMPEAAPPGQPRSTSRFTTALDIGRSVSPNTGSASSSRCTD